MALTKWKIHSTGMYRPWGKTWPEVSFTSADKKIWARDNNSKRPSQSYSTEDLTVTGVKALLNRCISLPHPPTEMIEQFVASVNERLKK